MIRCLLLFVAVTWLGTVAVQGVAADEALSVAELEDVSKQGQTLPIEVTTRFPMAAQSVPNDTGINVLVDLAHRDCNRTFQFDKTGSELDLAMDPARLREKWGKGKEWTKIWWVWQKLDDRYGPTWYPRWRWVQHTRWRDQPDR